MNVELSNRATILAAQYAGNSTEMLYPPQIGIWIIGGIILFLVILLAVGSYIFDKITYKEHEQIWKEVNYDNRTVGEERSRDRDGQRTQSSR